MIHFDFSKSLLPEEELRSTTPFPQTDFFADETSIPLILQLAEKKRSQFKNLLVLGIGGSSQGLKTLARALLPHQTNLSIQESPDPQSVRQVMETIDWPQTCINVISKSGNTIETLALFDFFQKSLEKKVGKQWTEHIVVTTGKGKGKLFQLAQKNNLDCLWIPQNMGGRFSVFSAVGLFPLSMFGFDITSILHGAKNINREAIHKNGMTHYLLNQKKGKSISVMMIYSDLLKPFGGWYSQLWGESLGKKGKGQTPIACQGPQAQHSLAQLILDGPKDKIVTFIKISANDSLGQLMEKECNATAQAFFEKDVPSVTLTLPKLDGPTLGELLISYQIQTAFVGELLGVNPYDQPAVEKIKQLF